MQPMNTKKQIDLLLGNSPGSAAEKLHEFITTLIARLEASQGYIGCTCHVAESTPCPGCVVRRGNGEVLRAFYGEGR